MKPGLASANAHGQDKEFDKKGNHIKEREKGYLETCIWPPEDVLQLLFFFYSIEQQQQQLAAPYFVNLVIYWFVFSFNKLKTLWLGKSLLIHHIHTSAGNEMKHGICRHYKQGKMLSWSHSETADSSRQ